MNHPFISGSRFLLLALAVTLCFTALLGRLYFLHVHKSASLVEEAQESRSRLVTLGARRGDIVDSRGNLLATTSAVVTVGVDPHVLQPEDFTKIDELADLLRMDAALVREKFLEQTRMVQTETGLEERAIRWHKLAEGIEEPVYEQVNALGIRAVYGNRHYERQYPGGPLAAHILGFVNRSGQPSFGVEAKMDFYLRGHEGWRELERDGHRRELAQFRRREVEPTPGLGVELSIDSTLQHAVEREIASLVAEFDPAAATIIVSEPATGQILALANYPSFDPNLFWEFELENHRNRAVTDRFEPGSTFKIVPAAAALNEGLVKPFDTFDCSQASVPYRGRDLRLPTDHHPLGELSVEEIVVKSSNRGAALLGLELGEDSLYRYASAFGFGEATGFDLGNEASGQLHPVRAWDGLTISRLPMGHALSATPLQVHAAMGALANDGVLMEPRTIRRVIGEEGETVLHFPPRARRRVVRPETARLVAGMLEKVVGLEGTARQAYIADYGVAGKTGTTQKIINGRYSNRHHVASFSGFFPVNNPRVVITVVVDDPQCDGVGYGGRVAAPAFRNVARACIRHLGIPPMEEVPAMIMLSAADNRAPARADDASSITTVLQ